MKRILGFFIFLIVYSNQFEIIEPKEGSIWYLGEEVEVKIEYHNIFNKNSTNVIIKLSSNMGLYGSIIEIYEIKKTVDLKNIDINILTLKFFLPEFNFVLKTDSFLKLSANIDNILGILNLKLVESRRYKILKSNQKI
jgi:hypothetical protein